MDDVLWVFRTNFPRSCPNVMCSTSTTNCNYVVHVQPSQRPGSWLQIMHGLLSRVRKLHTLSIRYRLVTREDFSACKEAMSTGLLLYKGARNDNET